MLIDYIIENNSETGKKQSKNIIFDSLIGNSKYFFK